VEPDTINIILGFAILIILYTLLVLEIMHRTATALLTASIVLALNTFLRFSDFNELVEGIDMDTILLLMSMMMFVGVLSRTGAFSYLATIILLRFHNKPFMLIAILSGITALVSAFIDNVPYTTTMLPVVVLIANSLGVEPITIAWALLLGTTLGGNLTYIGASANVTAVRILEKHGYHASFWEFIKISLPFNTVSVVTGWILYEIFWVILG